MSPSAAGQKPKPLAGHTESGNTMTSYPGDCEAGYAEAKDTLTPLTPDPSPIGWARGTAVEEERRVLYPRFHQ
jgi:hypothetical protein